MRYLANDGEKRLDLMSDAGHRALEHGGTQPGDVEFVIYAGVGRGWLKSATANVVQHGLKLVNTTCFSPCWTPAPAGCEPCRSRITFGPDRQWRVRLPPLRRSRPH